MELNEHKIHISTVSKPKKRGRGTLDFPVYTFIYSYNKKGTLPYKGRVEILMNKTYYRNKRRYIWILKNSKRCNTT